MPPDREEVDRDASNQQRSKYRQLMTCLRDRMDDKTPWMHLSHQQQSMNQRKRVRDDKMVQQQLSQYWQRMTEHCEQLDSETVQKQLSQLQQKMADHWFLFRSWGSAAAANATAVKNSQAQEPARWGNSIWATITTIQGNIRPQKKVQWSGPIGKALASWP